jgi:tripartite-type tricarboxylate transporter receptor subunit TctC
MQIKLIARTIIGTLLACATLGVAAQTVGLAKADASFPSKPIRVVVPSPPGGPPDLIMRIISPKMSSVLGQSIIVENKPGAGGLVGTAYLAKVPADGYSWLFTTASHVNIPPFHKNVAYDSIKDFTHVSLVAQNYGQALVIPTSLPANNVSELVALAKKSPGKLSYASAGLGTASHIPAEVFKAKTQTDILMVPYKGVAEVMSDLLSGRVDMFFVGTQIAIKHVEAGKLRALALTGNTRWKGLPIVPTMQEAGIPNFDVVNWFGLWLPAGAPKPIVDKIYDAVQQAIKDPEVIKQFEAQGLYGVGMPPTDFAKFVAQEAQAATAIAKSLPQEASK